MIPKDLIQIINGSVVGTLLAVFSALVVATWAYYKFTKLRVAKKALKIEIIPKIYTNGDSNVIEVVIELTNTGTIPIFNKPRSKSLGKFGCVLKVKALPALDVDSSLEWEDEKLESIIKPIEYLGDYDWIVLEPGVPCEVKGYAVFSTKHSGLLLLRAEFTDRDDLYWKDFKIIDTRPGKPGNLIVAG